MKRKTSTTPTKIWSFGALAPTTNEKLLLEQLFLGSRYYNSLIEIEQRRRKNYRDARSEAAPTLAMLEAEWKKLDAEFTLGLDALPKVKGKKVLTPELQELKARRKDVAARMKAERAAFAANEEAKLGIKKVDDAAQVEVKAARAATDLYWGSYLLIEKQIEQARQSKLDPRFRRFEGNGRVGVQLQGGLTLPELLSGQDTRLRLVARQSTPKVKKPKAQHEVHIRVGSDGRAPIWAVLPVVLHREIPADAKIQWAWIKVKNVGGVRKYFLQIAMESDTFDLKHSPKGTGTVAINFGWRAHEDGRRRVAYAVDSNGEEQEFCIPAKIESSLAFANSLRSARDLHFEDAKRATMGFMALAKEKDARAPEARDTLREVLAWMKEETEHIAQWRNPKRLAKVSGRLSSELLEGDDSVKRWVNERLSHSPKLDLFAPATEIFQWLGGGNTTLRMFAIYLELWRRKDRHLWEWEAHQRANTLAHRNELFRVWSRRLADRYREIRIEEFDLRKMAKTPEPEEESKPKEFRSARAAAAPGEFRMRLTEVTGSKITKGAAHGNTVTCYECGALNERSLLTTVICEGCGADWDQDANNCRNQLAKSPDSGRQPDVVAAE
jgi:hypothetical protein